MTFEPLQHSDLPEIASMQPPDWNDIIASQKSFIQSEYCFPYKLVEHGSILGIGSYAKFGNSVWLAQIIVHPLARSRGVGYMITKALMQCSDVQKASSVQLIATDLGLPLYQKCGFTKSSSYLFYRGGKIVSSFDKEIVVQDANEKQYDEIIQLDKNISSEDRSELLIGHLKKAKITLEENTLTGFFLPTLKEGLIVAENTNAGFTLMKEKSKSSDVFVVPEQNNEAIKLLEQSGFNKWRQGIRMWKGENLSWQPEKIYSRVSGGFG